MVEATKEEPIVVQTPTESNMEPIDDKLIEKINRIPKEFYTEEVRRILLKVHQTKSVEAYLNNPLFQQFCAHIL
jgi:hypothetical protein